MWARRCLQRGAGPHTHKRVTTACTPSHRPGRHLASPTAYDDAHAPMVAVLAHRSTTHVHPPSTATVGATGGRPFAARCWFSSANSAARRCASSAFFASTAARSTFNRRRNRTYRNTIEALPESPSKHGQRVLVEPMRCGAPQHVEWWLCCSRPIHWYGNEHSDGKQNCRGARLTQNRCALILRTSLTHIFLSKSKCVKINRVHREKTVP